MKRKKKVVDFMGFLKLVESEEVTRMPYSCSETANMSSAD